MLVVKRDGQWFSSDVGRVVLGSDPLKLDNSCPDFLLDMVDDAYQVLACAVGVNRMTYIDGGLRVCVDDSGAIVCKTYKKQSYCLLTLE